MNAPEKFNLAEMLAEIKKDTEAEAPDDGQQSNISQSVIMTLIQNRVGGKGPADD